MSACLLCGENAPLLGSHVLPAFAFKALKKRSPTGHIRHSENPNQRVQDGIVINWLCQACEALFSRWEREFCNQVFHPWNNGVKRTPYGDWMLKFCVSLSWRVLRYCKGRNPNAVYSADDERQIALAELTWRKFLLGKRPHPGQFSQQFVIFDLVESTTIRDLPTNFNRYMMGAIAMDVVGSSRSTFTWTKLGRFQIFGTITAGPNRFEGTKVHVKEGVLEPGRFVLPAGLLDLFREKAGHASGAMDSLSDAQFEKIDAAFHANIDKFIGSQQFAAMQADAALFGEDVIIRKPRNKAED